MLKVWVIKVLALGLTGNFSTGISDLVPQMSEYLFHDASASLVRDGVLLAAVEEERFNRIKKTTKFPVNAIRACFDSAGVAPEEIDAIGYHFGEEHVDNVLNYLYAQHQRVPVRYSRELIKQRLQEEFDWDVPDEKLIYALHHDAHAMSTYLHSGMREALVVVLDGRGEDNSGTIYRGVDGRLEKLADYPVMKSLGLLYLGATQLLGYGFGDEYKVMGLAPYGDPAICRDLFAKLYTLRDKGEYDLHPIMTPNLVNPLFLEHGFLPRRKGEPFTQQHKDFAAGLQDAVETIALHVFGYWAEFTGLPALCFGGGVAHNSSLNGVILGSGLFREVFVHPASHDAGAGEGAAFVAMSELGHLISPGERLRSASLGPALGTEAQVADRLSAWSSVIDFERHEDIVGSAARLLADGAVLGWAHGRSEFGPRALGNRSILADARPSENQTRINAMVKKRESFRPFAPVVTEEAANAYFDLPDTAADYEFMSFVVPVLTERRQELGAVTHVDGTARVQLVDSLSSTRFHQLVARFGELTGTPVLLNTSFNNNAEPIVQSVDDVVACFLTTDLDFLVVEDFLVRRKGGSGLDLDQLVPRFRPVTRLAERVGDGSAAAAAISREIYLDYFGGPVATVSEPMYELLRKVDGSTTVGALVATTGVPDSVRDELYGLWQQRLLTLTPA
ncbi:MAG TPA: carbamoyltransferase C-terminal domain-containing protein [Actinophytocola sp.]|uniref:carbamoyltransferase family protein n=1 Tax=Actinophytocola sp. TaxID=1872138 RepID=UPI002DB6F517|nr:carbamoyltransferase C-terminal domain-containing protein [Actinophytocola sp.]HEU5472496.1 carbamoyltransferase C-terminal domain-containing protein [Actinophytocola sp.]